MSDEKEVRFSETAKYKANNKYIKDKYSQVKLSMPNQEADIFNAFCEARIADKKKGKTVSDEFIEIASKAGFIREAIIEKMERHLAAEAEKKQESN